jgi:hypothetical protein
MWAICPKATTNSSSTPSKMSNDLFMIYATGERKAHWPGAAARALAIGTKLNRLLPVQCSEKLCSTIVILMGLAPRLNSSRKLCL